MRAQPCLQPSGWAIAIPCGCAGHPRACTGTADGNCFCSPGNCPETSCAWAGSSGTTSFCSDLLSSRSRIRWTAHWFLAWGCLLAAAVTFPLSFGWVRFETARDNQEIYNAFMFGIPVGSFPSWNDHGRADLQHSRYLRAAMVLIGVFFAMWRRGRDRDARASSSFPTTCCRSSCCLQFRLPDCSSPPRRT